MISSDTDDTKSKTGDIETIRINVTLGRTPKDPRCNSDACHANPRDHTCTVLDFQCPAAWLLSATDRSCSRRQRRCQGDILLDLDPLDWGQRVHGCLRASQYH